MKRLVAENLIRSRPRIGCEVLAHGDRIWKGRVICAFIAALEGSYYFSMVMGSLRRAMIARGYLFISVAVDEKEDRKLDFSQLDALCGEKTDFIIAIHPPEALAVHVATYDVPALAFVDKQEAPGLDKFRRSNIRDMEPVANAICRAGARRVLLVNYADGSAERALLERFGMEVEPISVKASGPNFLEDLKHRSMELVFDRFAPERSRPDLVFFTDDYVAFGGLLALARRGVSSPGDVGIITMSNRGVAPVWSHTLSRIEFDPLSDGEVLADHAVARIEGRPAPDVRMRQRFISGETFPCSVEQ